jgi:hypothetical protein
VHAPSRAGSLEGPLDATLPVAKSSSKKNVDLQLQGASWEQTNGGDGHSTPTAETCCGLLSVFSLINCNGF